MQVLSLFVLHNGWTDPDVGFSGSPSKANIEYPRTTQYTSEANELYISECLFKGCSGDYGGAIYYTTMEKCGEMLVEKSTFNQCTCTYYGGAIYKENGECVVKQCCGLQCYSTNNNGQFIYTSLNNANQKNRVLDSSVSHSMKDSDHPSWSSTLDLRLGTIQINTVNLSNNICNYYSAVYALPSTSDTACSITYSSINSNEARTYQIIWFNRNTNYEITQSNIINNIDQGSFGLIQCDGPTNITDCCIMKNVAKYIIAGYNGYTYLKNCSIDFPLNGNITGSVSISETAETSFIIPIVCTNYCHASYDSTGDILKGRLFFMFSR